MNFTLQRSAFEPLRTPGRIVLGTRLQAWTLEDAVRLDGSKIDGETAIPAGRYEVVIDYSQRFRRELPRLLAVPGFTGIRIHSGNTEADTRGCILVGKQFVNHALVASQMALAELIGVLDRALAKEPVFLDVRNPPEEEIHVPEDPPVPDSAPD